ncbi:MAG: hypothetical protein K0Q57_840, partial [Gammaproteobacteria bacterium]|nr:hypothetical protein [Gammaproteobacteria bacterium]
MYTTQEVVDLLDQEGPSNVVTPFLDNLRPQSDNKHGNSFLHEAIARNRTSAAIYLIALAAYRDKPSLFMKDGCPSSKSTPLILASKTGNNHSALLLVGLYKNSDRLNARDYIGNTALHYACLMRNNLLIEALILQGADANIRNHEGKSALEYYLLEASSKDLKYYYGECDGLPYLMSNVCDWDQPYQGTNHSSFSNYRWFLIHIVINFGLAKEIAMPDLSETQGKWWFAFDRMGLNAQGIQR